MPNLGKNFYTKLVQISSELGMKPEDIIAIMVSESGLNPAAKNTSGNATGLIQFMPATLKGMGFNESHEKFGTLSGEEQLPYVKKAIEYGIKLLGKPFESAAQYYTSNFFPIALKLPGIKSQNPNCIFIEQNPKTINGTNYSKKYYDVGVKLSIDTEKAAYNGNPLFHGTIPGAITFGDMVRQIEKIKNQPAYKNAIEEVRKLAPSSLYEDSEDDEYAEYENNEKVNVPVPITSVQTDTDLLVENVDSMLKEIRAADNMNKHLYHKYLPINNISIIVNSENNNFKKALCYSLDNFLLSKSSINGSIISCKIPGPSDDCLNAVMEISAVVKEVFSKFEEINLSFINKNANNK
jgi:hypothetical protein